MINVCFTCCKFVIRIFHLGAFSHSFGLETYIQEGKIINKDTFSLAINQYVTTQFAYTDGLACRLAYEAIQQKNQ